MFISSRRFSFLLLLLFRVSIVRFCLPRLDLAVFIAKIPVGLGSELATKLMQGSILKYEFTNFETHQRFLQINILLKDFLPSSFLCNISDTCISK